MTISTIQNSFGSGEISPSMFGRMDVERWHKGGSTIRNAFVNFRGGASSRAGLAYVGTCKQSGSAAPPRDINFQFSINQGYALEFGDNYMRIKSNGGYVVEATKAITGITQANPAVLTVVGHGYTTGDWVYIASVTGMTNFNNLAWIVTVTDANHITLTDMFGNVVNSTTYSTYISGGTTARLYTLATPYAAVDLPYLKYTQSADVMTLTCSNPTTNTEYIPYDLKRLGATNWTLTANSFASVISAPTGVAVTANNSAAVDTYYGYVVTAVDANTGQESVASSAVSAHNNNISLYAGSNVITWVAVTGASSYNIYKCTPSYNAGISVGVPYGYCGTALGTSFTDSNILADFTKVPPVHKDPFARGAITFVNRTAGGAGYTQGTIGYTITTATGSGFVGTPIVVGGAFSGFLIVNSGSGYAGGDTIAITDSGVGAGATATLTVGAQTGTYPGVTAYYQQRKSFANSFNYPNTYWMTQPSAFYNMDSSIPVIDSDAITGTPWAQQINGIQAMIPMPNGLVVFTGKGAWQVNGGSSAAITPADQQATPQGSSGCSATVQPIPVNYNILYVQSKGATVRELEYNYFTQIYIGKDMTIFSNHLFYNHTISQWAYAEEPYKLIWSVRDDGIMLSFTYLKEQESMAWARHDTKGQFVGVCTVSEPPVDAVYCIVKRYINGQWKYYSERMNNRLWQNAEQSFCVDAGLSNSPNSYGAATLTASQSGTGIGVTFTASAGIFSAGDIGNVIRMGGGIATITGYTSPTVVTATITTAITSVIPDDTSNTPLPAINGAWTITTPITVVHGLNHLEGQTVSILADGGVVPQQVVTNGSITLPQAASLITVGLPYIVQVQTMYLDPQGAPMTVQGKRKSIFRVTIRFEASRGAEVGANQPDSSTLPNNATLPWTNMKPIKERNANIYAGYPISLFTGDHIINVVDGWDTKGQVAIQSQQPLPINILAVVSEFMIGDTPAG
ncbi:MAG: hypothetical protein KGJ90_05920 [Patescibacteria group bacterium]|nr:hypothetical protein [Patescibacteria group bacterium]